MKESVFVRAQRLDRNKPHVYWDPKRSSWMYVIDGMNCRADWAAALTALLSAAEWCQCQNCRWKPVDK